MVVVVAGSSQRFVLFLKYELCHIWDDLRGKWLVCNVMEVYLCVLSCVHFPDRLYGVSDTTVEGFEMWDLDVRFKYSITECSMHWYCCHSGAQDSSPSFTRVSLLKHSFKTGGTHGNPPADGIPEPDSAANNLSYVSHHQLLMGAAVCSPVLYLRSVCSAEPSSSWLWSGWLLLLFYDSCGVKGCRLTKMEDCQ